MQDEPTRWNSSLYMIQSVVEQKMAIYTYGADGPIPVLTASQLDIATKVINILSPIKEITRNISAEFCKIPFVRALRKVLEKEVEDTGVRSMKNKMLDSLHSRFDEVEDKDFLVLATILDPRYNIKLFHGYPVTLKLLLFRKFCLCVCMHACVACVCVCVCVSTP